MKQLLYALTALCLCACEGEKALNIVEGNLPIMTSTLYMVGDATPAGWSIDAPTALTPSEDNSLVFGYEGELKAGEFKLCLVPGSWDVPFIRPDVAGAEIGTAPVVDAPFQMHAGDPDDKWRVSSPGIYRLAFNLRQWTMSAERLGDIPEQPEQPREPIAAEALYMVGDATPAGWNIDAPTAFAQKDSHIFIYEGPLTVGKFKCCTQTGSWDVPFIRPDVAGAEIGTAPVVDAPFQMHAGDPDDKWRVSSPGIYRLAFNLRQWTMSAERLGDIPEQPEQPREPIAAEALYMVGDATPAGWNIDAPTAFAQKDSHIFIYEGPLTVGEFKCCTQTGSWDAPFIRPATAGEELTRAGFEAHEFVMHAGDPDDKWHVADEAVYRLTFDLAAWTVKAEYVKDIERTE